MFSTRPSTTAARAYVHSTSIKVLKLKLSDEDGFDPQFIVELPGSPGMLFRGQQESPGGLRR